MKGGLFLGVGLAPLAGARRLWLVMVPAAIIGLGLAGMPLTGGSLAKLAIKPVLGYGLAGGLGIASSVATALLMTHFLRRVAALPATKPAGAQWRALRWSWLVVAAASIVVPWTLYPTLLDGSLADALSPSVLWSSLWPVLLGVGLCLRLPNWIGIHVDGLEHEAVLPVSAGVARAAIGAAAALEHLDTMVRRWPVAVLLLLTVAIALGCLMVR